MRSITKLIPSLLTILLLISCAKKEVDFQDPLLTNRDTTVSPSDNFLNYANGGWFKRNPIPDGNAQAAARTLQLNPIQASTIHPQIAT